MRSQRAKFVCMVLTFCVVAWTGAEARAQARKARSPKARPDLANVKYGPHQRNVLDLWKAKADSPTPLVVFIHGLRKGELDTPKAHKLYEAASPINHLGAGDPPVYAFYSEPRGPLPANAKPGQGIHHINFGTYLKERMDKLAVECIVRHRDEGASPDKEAVEFFVRHLRPQKTR